jgi:hypothetical protein
MKDSIPVNHPKKKMAIFKSLMSVSFHAIPTKTQAEITKDLTKLEKQGKLRIYHPERRSPC